MDPQKLQKPPPSPEGREEAVPGGGQRGKRGGRQKSCVGLSWLSLADLREELIGIWRQENCRGRKSEWYRSWGAPEIGRAHV